MLRLRSWRRRREGLSGNDSGNDLKQLALFREIWAMAFGLLKTVCMALGAFCEWNVAFGIDADFGGI